MELDCLGSDIVAHVVGGDGEPEVVGGFRYGDVGVWPKGKLQNSCEYVGESSELLLAGNQPIRFWESRNDVVLEADTSLLGCGISLHGLGGLLGSRKGQTEKNPKPEKRAECFKFFDQVPQIFSGKVVGQENRMENYERMVQRSEIWNKFKPEMRTEKERFLAFGVKAIHLIGFETKWEGGEGILAVERRRRFLYRPCISPYYQNYPSYLDQMFGLGLVQTQPRPKTSRLVWVGACCFGPAHQNLMGFVTRECVLKSIH